MRDALGLLRRTRERYLYERILSHRFPLESINEVFAAPDRGNVTRVCLEP